MRTLRLLTLASLIAAPIALHATEIVYTDSFTASGSLGKTDFTNALVTITGEANPANEVNEGGGIFALALPVTFTIAGESGTFTQQMSVFLNQQGGAAGTGEAGFSSPNFAFIFTENPAFEITRSPNPSLPPRASRRSTALRTPLPHMPPPTGPWS
jgi:hypothetical protein